jgi:predicted 3-demethylubiquinone-9 3-methyltransferase (glyoxalase superfamily)
MPISVKALMPCLWFDTQAEEAASHYVSIFPKSKLGKITRYGKEGKEIHGKPAGSVMTVEFEIEGVKFLALNGGPQFKFTPALSLIVNCDDQAEIDRLWEKLAEGGAPGQCGWLTDKFGVSWQIVPRALPALLTSKDDKAGDRLMREVLTMKKLDITRLQQAVEPN